MYVMGMNLSIGTIPVIAVCLGVVVDDTIHFLATYCRQRKGGADGRKAVAFTLHRTGSALIATTVLLLVGFGTFLFSDLAVRAHFGLTSIVILAAAPSRRSLRPSCGLAHRGG